MRRGQTPGRGMRAGRLVVLVALLLAGFFPVIEILDIDESIPEESSADQLAAVGARQTATSRLLRANRASTSPGAARVSLAQRIAANMARVDCPMAIAPCRRGRHLQRAHLIRRAARIDSPTADPA